MKIKIKVVPRASRDAVVGWLGDELKLAVTAPPEKGRANKAVVALLARTLGVDARDVSVVAGHGSPRKTVSVEGMEAGRLRALLGILGASPANSDDG